MLVPVDKQSGHKRKTSEQERGRLKKERDRANWDSRNPDSKWKR